MNDKVPLSFLIPIRNETDNLPRCLNSIPWADEIFVVDSQSTDGSIDLAQSYGARVVQFEFNGVWPKKKNWALQNLPFKHPWVFILDADEELLSDAREEIAGLISKPGSEMVGYWINRRSFHGEMAAPCLFPKLEPSALSASPGPL